MTNALTNQIRSLQRLQFVANDFTGGFVSQAATYNIDESFLADMQNMELIEGMWQKRKGYSLVGSFQGVSSPEHTNKGLHIFKKQGNIHFLGIYNNTLYDTYQYSVDGAGKIISSTLPDTDRFRFIDFRNNCYIASGRTSLMKYDGSTVRNLPSPYGSILATYDNRVLCAGINGDELSIYFSNQGHGDVWPALNYVALDGDSSEQITALVPLQGKLFIFTNKSIYTLDGTMENYAITKAIDGIGAVSPEAIQVFGDIFYFIMGNGKFYMFDGGSFPTEISVNIDEYIQSHFHLNHFKYAVTAFYKNSVWFTLDNSNDPQERVTLVYFPSHQCWSKYVGISAQAYVQLNHALLFTGVNNQGSIYQFGTQYKDDTTYIDGFLKTVKWSFDGLENMKRFQDLYIRAAVQGGGGNGFDIEFIVDDSVTAQIHVADDIATPSEYWNKENWGEMYWGYAGQTSGSVWGQTDWDNFDWNGTSQKFSPKWGYGTWNAFKWGANREGTLPGDIGTIYRKLYLSQYNIIQGKTLQLVFRDKTPNNGFRFENLTLMLIRKAAR